MKGSLTEVRVDMPSRRLWSPSFVLGIEEQGPLCCVCWGTGWIFDRKQARGSGLAGQICPQRRYINQAGFGTGVVRCRTLFFTKSDNNMN